MRTRGFYTHTLGCKLNQFDTAALEGELAARGLVPTESIRSATFILLNTCTVTHRADSDARKWVRRARRENPDGTLVVTGCYAEREAETLAALPEVDHVFGNQAKPDFAELLDRWGILPDEHAITSETQLGDRGCDESLLLPHAVYFGRKSRAFLRVQDGCRLSCSYCVIPSVRGASRSVPLDALVEAVERLHHRGYQEVVLTGVNTGDYGRDLDPRLSLVNLLDALVARTALPRIRLNSLEPRTITDEVIERLAHHPDRLAPHLQIPLQSGSDAVLQRMRRNYRTEFYRERLDRLRTALPQIGLGADVIVGFPGESDEEFEETYRFIADSPLNYLHVFSWSARPGTPAAELPQRIPERVIGERNRALRELADRKGQAFRASLLGTRQRALVLDPSRTAGQTRGLTGNFFEVEIPAHAGEPGALIDVEIGPIDGARTQARPLVNAS